ncbi:hypothetical protein TEA_011636 [Camellia sinensis var. sinensis]|uniref:Uncharacterized protein n=1 Tax=Camellia sinensis var. sinensis TaxID=542762 RepID=A0A4S4DDC4_CAMSN|nr:hypothetical protein TEA_011636 [Camellia sinensis var. sinensis]
MNEDAVPMLENVADPQSLAMRIDELDQAGRSQVGLTHSIGGQQKGRVGFAKAKFQNGGGPKQQWATKKQLNKHGPFSTVLSPSWNGGATTQIFKSSGPFPDEALSPSRVGGAQTEAAQANPAVSRVVSTLRDGFGPNPIDGSSLVVCTSMGLAERSPTGPRQSSGSGVDSGQHLVPEEVVVGSAEATKLSSATGTAAVGNSAVQLQ